MPPYNVFGLVPICVLTFPRVTRLSVGEHLDKTIHEEGGTDWRDAHTTQVGSHRVLCRRLEARPVEFGSRKAAVPRHHLHTRAGYIGVIWRWVPARRYRTLDSYLGIRPRLS